MQNSPMPSVEQFQEEKVLSLQDSLSLSPNPKANPYNTQGPLDPIPSNQPANADQCTSKPKPARQRRSSLEDDKNMNRGHWLLEENKKYHWFLEIHYKHFVNRHMRRMDKIFKTMEIFIGSRQAEQCRSHHQKMEKKYHNFITIISNLRQQHYSSEDVEPIAQDIQASGFRLSEPLATIPMLREQEKASATVPAQNVKERRKGSWMKYERVELNQIMNSPVIEQLKEERQLDEVEAAEIPEQHYQSLNMLEESNLNMGQLRMYHQKEEDNSCFFDFN